MRPVNLIPPEERRGERPPARTGAVGYLVVAGLALAVLAVAGLTLTNRQISDREAEKTRLEAEQAQAQAKADKLRAFTQFRTMKEARVQTVASLAKSRFDWERVMRELAHVIPGDVWLINLAGSVSPDVSVESGAESSLRGEVAGPALDIVGCATSQDTVARFAAALEDIDGVTRVTVGSVQRPQLSEGSSGGGAGGEASGDDCRTRDFIVQFELVAAFDAVPVPEGAEATPPAGSAPTPSAPAAGNDGAQPASADDGGVSETRQEQARSKESAAEKSDKAGRVRDAVPGA